MRPIDYRPEIDGLRAIAFAAVGSFALTLPFSGWSPSAAFYLLPARGWELALGAWVAASRIDLLPARRRRLASDGAMLGLVLVVGSCRSRNASIRPSGTCGCWMAKTLSHGTTITSVRPEPSEPVT